MNLHPITEEPLLVIQEIQSHPGLDNRVSSVVANVLQGPCWDLVELFLISMLHNKVQTRNWVSKLFLLRCSLHEET